MLNRSVSHIPLPQTMRALPISDRGFPIPWFVWIKPEGGYDFRVMGPGKLVEAHERKLCWICGGRLDRQFCFVIGSVGAINCISAEPPSHVECGEYSARACPFLANPHARRNVKDLPGQAIESGGVMTKQNDGIAVLWITSSYDLLPNKVFVMGDPLEVRWFAEGRHANRTEVAHAIEGMAMPQLERQAWLYGYQGYLSLQQLAKRAKANYPD